MIRARARRLAVLAATIGALAAGLVLPCLVFAGSAVPPSIDSESASHITQDSATLEAQVNPQGLETAYEIWVLAPCGGECLELIQVAQGSLPTGTEDQSVSVDLAPRSDTGILLEPETTYAYWVVAKNSAGETKGKHERFTTPAASAPSIDSESASHITQDDVTLEAQINPQGLKTKYEIWVEAPCGGECIDYISVGHGSLPAVTEDQSVSVELAPQSDTGILLEPNTTYWYWMVAENSAGETKGKYGKFTTLAATEPPIETEEGSTTPPTTQPTTPPTTPPTTQQSPGAGSNPSRPETPQQAPPAPDVEVTNTSVVASPSGTVAVDVSCPAAESSCTGTITLRTLAAVDVGAAARRSDRRKMAILTLVSGSFTVSGGRVEAVKLHLVPRARALLAHTRVLHTQAVILTHDPSGVEHTTQTVVTIRSPKAT
jgi:hypothetical protein